MDFFTNDHKQIAGLPRDWVGAKLCLCVFLVFPYEGEKHINKIPPPKSRDSPVKILFTCFFLYVFFSTPKTSHDMDENGRRNVKMAKEWPTSHLSVHFSIVTAIYQPFRTWGHSSFSFLFSRHVCVWPVSRSVDVGSGKTDPVQFKSLKRGFGTFEKGAFLNVTMGVLQAALLLSSI